MKAPTRQLLEALSLLLILTILLPSALPAPVYAASPASTSQAALAAAPFACTYIVRPGDDLFRIGLRFGVSFVSLAEASGLTNFNLIFPGMMLRVPCAAPPPAPTVCNIHIVQRGEWLALIARNFNVSAQSIANLNHLSNPNILYIGQRLLIPCSSVVPAHGISITAPRSNQAMCSPIMVSGAVTISPFESTLRGRVYNAQGMVVGENSIHVNAPMGQSGTLSGTITFNPAQVRNGSAGRVELAELSPRDGSLVSSSSVPIVFACAY